MLRATSDTAVASRVRSVPVKPARTAISRAACRAATMSGSPVIATRTSSSRTGPRSSSGSLSRAQSSHSSRCCAASTSRWRRRSALDRASSTGRQRSVGGSTLLEGQQVLDPQPGPGALELRGDGAGGAARVLGERAGGLHRRPRGPAGAGVPCRRGAARPGRSRRCSSEATTSSSARSGSLGSRARCWLRCSRSCWRHMVAMTLRTVAMA